MARTEPNAMDIDAFEADALALLRQRLATFGIEDSGLGPYYALQIDAGTVFSPADRMLMGLLSTDCLGFEDIVEAGAGYGQLGLALAAAGQKVCLVEIDAKRVACIEALKAGLSARYPDLAANAVILQGKWPHDPAGRGLARTLLVAVDFVFTTSEEEADQAIDALGWYGGAIIDAARFIEARPTPQACAEFFDILQYRGLPAPMRLQRHGDDRDSDFVFLTTTPGDIST